MLLLRADTETACLYMAPKCTLSALTEEDRGQQGPQLLISETERKHFAGLTKTQVATQHTEGGQRQQRVKLYTLQTGVQCEITYMCFTQCYICATFLNSFEANKIPLR